MSYCPETRDFEEFTELCELLDEKKIKHSEVTKL